jgi:outer membrane protein assembly factor BamB
MRVTFPRGNLSAPRSGYATRLRPCAVAWLVAASMLAGCGTFSSKEEAPLEGERISVLQQDQIFNADPDAAAVQVVLPPATANAEWPQAGGNANHAMHHLALSAAPETAWRASVGAAGSAYRPIVTEPVSAGGRIFALDSATNLGAFDLASGATLWRLDLTPAGEDELFGGGLATDGTHVYATTNYGYVYGIDAAQGQILWTTRIDAPIRAAPSLANGKVIVVTLDNRTIAMTMDTGDVLWTHSGPLATASLLGSSAPAIEAGIAMVAYTSGEIVALDIETGQAKWSDTIARRLVRESAAKVTGITGRIVIDRGTVFISGNSAGTVAMDLQNGLRSWESALPSATGPWVAGEFLFMITVDQKLLCLTRAGGQVKWFLDLPRFVDPEDRSGPIIWSGPVVAGDRVILISTEGELLTVSPYTGEILGSGTVGAGSRVAPIVVNGGLYLLLDDATLVALH